MGWSLGAHLISYVASEEHRLATCVAYCGAFDVCADTLALPRGCGPREAGRHRHGAHGLVDQLIRQPTMPPALERLASGLLGDLAEPADEPGLPPRPLRAISARPGPPRGVCTPASRGAPMLAMRLPLIAALPLGAPYKALVGEATVLPSRGARQSSRLGR